MLPVAQRLIAEGHELIAVFSFPCDQMFNYNLGCKTLAQKHEALYIESPIETTHIHSLYQKQVEIFISCGYPYKIPPINEERAYGINIHPSVLPEARGIMPVPFIIIEQLKSAAGYSIHKLSEKFDRGDVLFQQKIHLTPDDSVETYTAKIIISAPQAVCNLLSDMKAQWRNTAPQDEDYASFYPAPDDEMRTLYWDDTVSNILRRANAFGRYGCLAKAGNHRLQIFACDGWEQPHQYKPGAVVTLQNNIAIIAAMNGFIIIKEFTRVNLQ